MRWLNSSWAKWCAGVWLLASVMLAQSETPLVFSGAVDGSAAVPVGSSFFIAATDEDNVLRFYSIEGGAPRQSFDLGAFLAVDPESPETDIEAAALIGQRAFWITAHGRDKRGRAPASRQRFFATDVVTNGSGIQLMPVGRPYTNLLNDLAAAPALRPYDLAGAARRQPEEVGGLNIEGLAATPEGHLLIGFRNPVPQGRALLVTLLNPDEMIAGKPATMGTSVLLDLGGLSIRDLVLWQGEYLIVAGSYDGSGASKLYRWRGGTAKPERVSQTILKGFNPEAVIVYPGEGPRAVQLLSDDGSKQKDFPSAPKGPERKRFRGLWVAP